MGKILKLLKSQKELLKMDRREINNAEKLAQSKHAKFEHDLDNIGLELGIKKDDLKNWKLKNDEYLEEKNGK